jgi:hypothetical protein
MSDYDGAILCPTGAIAIKEGQVCMCSSYLMALTATNSDKAWGVSAETATDDTGTALTLTSGDLWPFYMLGSGKVVNVRSLTAQTWLYGAAVYISASANEDGCVETASTGVTKIGHYVGPHNILTSGVTLIEVLLDVAGGD